MFIIASFILLLSINTNAQWVQVSNGIGTNGTVFDLAILGNNIYAAGLTGVWVTTNNGTNWTQTVLNNVIATSLITVGNNIFAGTDAHGVYISTNNGTNWSQTGMNGQIIWSLAALGNNIFAGTNNSGVWVSSNNGSSWVQTLSIYPTTVGAFATIGSNIFAGTSQSDTAKIYLSTNNGTSWTRTGLNLGTTNAHVFSLTTLGNNLFAGTYNNVYLSTNNGSNWTQTTLFNRSVNALATIGSNIIAGTQANQDSGIFLSTNNGDSWTPVNLGFNNLGGEIVMKFLVTSTYIFAATNMTVWRRPLTEVNGIKVISTEIPKSFSLDQNYPNPFNPVTNIRFDLPKSSSVKLLVFDLLGREMSALVNGQLIAGTYQVDWNASNYPSGVYFYKLMTDNFNATKRMVLVK